MENKFREDDEKFEKELNQKIKEDETEIQALEQKLEHEKKELKLEKELASELKKDKEEDNNEDDNEQGQKNRACIIFVVNGTPLKVFEDENALLKDAVVRVLHESHNEGRPIADWVVKFNNLTLDVNTVIKNLNLPRCAELFLSLVAGVGGNL